MSLTTAEWIIVMFLAAALLVFLILSIILLAKLIDITKDAKKIIATSQDIANKADDVVGNVKDMTSIGGIVKTFASQYVDSDKKHNTKKAKKN